MASEIKLEALKENVDVVEVNAVKVSAGDTVAKDQPLLEVQAEKTALEVTAPVAGKVARILVKPGDQIKVGQVYCVIEADGAAEGGKKATPAQAEKKDGNGKETAPAAKKAEPARAPQEKEPARPAAPAAPPRRDVQPAAQAPPSTQAVVPAGPATRRLARELGVDLQQVRGTGRAGRVVEEDIKAYVRQLAAVGGNGAAAAPVQAPPLPSFEEWGEVEAQPLSPVRRATAKQMALAWSLIPHVTQHDLADITELEAFRKQQEGKGPRLTVTAFAIKAVANLLRQFPHFNSSLDLAGGRLLLKRYYHVGVAVDTDNGLLVPVLRDVERKGVRQLAEELTAMAERARQRKLDGKELKGGTFTITNLGGIGGTAFTPIINYPEVAILGMSRSRLEPVIRNGQVVPRLMLPLSLSYDHRVIDGADAARFTRRLAEMLENPLTMLL